PGAATAGSTVDLYTDPGLTTPGGSMAAGQRMRLVAEAPALPDGTRVVQVRALGGGDEGYVRADALTPADSTPATLYNYDPPGALIGPNGDYVFDTFRV